MKFKLLSLFPNYFTTPLKESLLHKAIEKGLIAVEVHNLRDYSDLAHQQVDDTPYGGGAGMILKPDIAARAVKKLKISSKKSLVILTDPSGQKFDQKLASDLSREEELIIISGRYEGVDQRFKDHYVDLEVSIGDFILNGGEAATLVMIDAIGRLIPGVIGEPTSLEFESFSTISHQGKQIKVLEYPQYTRPAEFEGDSVPEILLSGNHKEIAQWRADQSIKKTRQLRPDLLK